MARVKSLLVASHITFVGVLAQSTTAPASSAACSSTIAPQHAQPSVAPGWSAQVVASGLVEPRGIIFDQSGHLLVVESGRGISSLTLTGDDGPCVRADGEPRLIIPDEELNHGIALSVNGSILYASTPEVVYAWNYDSAQGQTTSDPREIIGRFGEDDGHSSRTLLTSQRVEGMLMVNRGSMSNLDPAALDPSTGVSQIKAFNLSNMTDTPYSFTEDGVMLGWGLRNSVGMAEEPVTGAIYSVENSVDNFERAGETIYQNNPGEELNFHGYVNGTQTPEQGGNHGYPSCYAAWDVNDIPERDGVEVGMQIAIGDQNDTVNDQFCREERVPPRLTFAAHMAPLDIKFNSNGTAAWVSFHGSWNRDEPIGYKLSVIGFENGEPTEPANSTTAAIDIVSNADLSRCPSECFRPVGLAFDGQGRLFMSSDTTGEIYVITQADGGAANDARPSTGLPPSTSATLAAPSSTKVPGAAAQSSSPSSWSGFAALWGGFMLLLV